MKVKDIVKWVQTHPATVNERGNLVYRNHRSSERYEVDFASDFKSEGWLQFDTDQDAWYFGVWVNPDCNLILTYAEGDWSLVLCRDDEYYNKEIQHMIDFYDEGKIFTAIDTENGQVDVVRQDRKEFLK